MVKRRNLDAGVAHVPVTDVAAAIALHTQQIMSDDEATQHAGASGFQQLLLDQHPPINEIIAADVVPRLLQFLVHPNEDIQYMSLWALTNIAAGQHEHTEYLVQQGAAVEFVRLMSSPRARLREQACWALGNIAGDGAALRDEVLAAGAMNAVLDVLRPEHAKLSAVKTATWTMSNLCRGKPPPLFNEVKAAIPVAARLIYSLDKEIEVDALWTLVFLSDGADRKQSAVAAETVCQRLVLLLKTNELAYLVPAVRTIGNLMSGDDDTTQKVIDNGALQALLPLLGHPRSGVRKEACWSVSNVLAGNPHQIQCCIDAGLIPPILQRLREDRQDIKREASWCIANAVSGANSKQIIIFVEDMFIIPPLVGLLTVDDESLVDMTLDAIERVLQVGNKLATPERPNPYVDLIEQADGTTYLDEVQNAYSDKLVAKAQHIMETYFDKYFEEAGVIDQQDAPYAWNGAPAQQDGGYTGFN